MVFAQTRDGELAPQLSIICERIGQRHAALAGQLGAGQIVQVLGRAGALQFVFGEAGQIQNAHALPHRPHLLIHRTMPDVFAPERMGIGRDITLQVQVHRALPAAARTKTRAFGLQGFIQRRGAQRPPGGALLIGEGRCVFVLVHLNGLGHGVFGGGVVAVATPVQRPQIPLGFAMHHPLGQRFAGTAALRNAEAEGVAVEKITQTRLRADIRVAVRRIGNRPVDPPLDTRARQRRHARHRVFNVLFQALKVVVPKLIGKVVRHAVQPHGGGFPLVGTEDEAFALLAQVIRGVGVTQQRQTGVATGTEFGHVLCHQVLVRHHNGRQMPPHHGHDLTGSEACGVHNDFGGDFALVRGHQPFAIGLLRQSRHAGVAANRAAQQPRFPRQGLCQLRGVNIAIQRIPQRALQVVGFDQRVAVFEV